MGDDGAQNRAEMEAMLDAAHTDGIAFLFATPYVTPGFCHLTARCINCILQKCVSIANGSSIR